MTWENAPYRLAPIDGDQRTAADFADALAPLLDGPALWGDDPLAENRRRAAWAAEAVATYGRRAGTATSESIHVTITDLLSDLRHLLDLARDVESDPDNAANLAEFHESGFSHYFAEIDGTI